MEYRHGNLVVILARWVKPNAFEILLAVSFMAPHHAPRIPF